MQKLEATQEFPGFRMHNETRQVKHLERHFVGSNDSLIRLLWNTIPDYYHLQSIQYLKVK